MLLVVEQLSRDVVIGYETQKVNGAFRSALYHVITIVLPFSQNCRFFSYFVVICFARVCREVVCKAIQIDKATCRWIIVHYNAKLQERLP